MAKGKTKSWKESTCESCDFSVNRRCRKNPLGEYTQYPVVNNTAACSEFKPKNKK